MKIDVNISNSKNITKGENFPIMLDCCLLAKSSRSIIQKPKDENNSYRITMKCSKSTTSMKQGQENFEELSRSVRSRIR